MTSSAIVVVANVYCQTDQKENIIPIFQKLVEATRKEPGSIKYELNQDLSDGTCFTFIEEWKDEQALELHFQMDHFKEAVEHITPLCAKPTEVFKYKRLF